tara:strand:- start:5340 stop:5783 length:444 start_codon:yes stop_codon:yes gene_type:complete
MALIIKGDTKIVSKKEAKEKVIIESEKQKSNGLEGLTPARRELRQEILNAKRHREFMAKIAHNEAVKTKVNNEDVKVVISTPEVVVEAKPVEENIIQDAKAVSLAGRPNFESMTKKELDLWAEENLGLTLDRRKTKATLIEEINQNM